MNIPRPASALLLLALVGAARADDVVLADGTQLHGRVTMETTEKVVLQLDSGRRVLPRNEVAAMSVAAEVAPVMRGGVLIAAEPVVTEARVDVPSWPPIPGAVYPDLALRDCHGRILRLSSLRGKTILLEPIAMTSPACQALSGARQYGAFGPIKPQENIDSVDVNLRRFGGGLSLDNPNLEYVQVVLFNHKLAAPSVAEVRAWAEHFHLADRPNVHVLVGTPEMISAETFDMIPGLHLVDRQFILRSEHFGRGGGSDLYRELLPLAAHLVATTN